MNLESQAKDVDQQHHIQISNLQIKVFYTNKCTYYSDRNLKLRDDVEQNDKRILQN